MPYYQRRVNILERKNKKKAYIFIFLSILLLLFIFFFGLPIAARFSSFISDFKKKDQPILSNDNTPPAPPQFNNFPDFTNNSSLDISGKTEEGATVNITFNDKQYQVVADTFGEFNLSVSLLEGENNFYALSKDQSGNESVSTENISIVYDDKAPDLEISNPQEGQNFYGAKQKEITISGKTEPESKLTVNDRFITVEDEGDFSSKYTLSDGQNTLNFKVTDMAQNLTEENINVFYTP